MITVDYCSDYFEIDQLYCITTSALVKNVRNHFARHGMPDELVADNGPNLLSDKLQNLLNNGIFYIQPFHHATVALMVELKLL